jgi:uncharacterized protein (TIGR03118 family)
MKNKPLTTCRVLAATVAAAALCSTSFAGNTNTGFVQVNLVSNTNTYNAQQIDPRLLNPWGIVLGEEAVWVNDNHSGLTTVYTPQGGILHFAITIPAPGSTSGGAPDGLVFNDTTQFVITNGSRHAPSTFIMSTEDGTITAWNHQVTGSNAVIIVDNSGSQAVYKGLALVRDSDGHPLLYAANFRGGVVEIYNGQFQQVSSFTDSNLPAHFAPFNVANILGHVFVSFALQKPGGMDDQSGPGNGFVDVFDNDGTFLRRFASQGPLNSPWGMTVAPANFGKFGGALLVGNFGDGRINGYDLISGKFLGSLTQTNGADLVIEGLWGLTFGQESSHEREWGFNARLYFTAGPNDENDGLLGFIRPNTQFHFGWR